MEVLVGSTFGIDVSPPPYAAASSSQENNASSYEIVASGGVIGARDDDSSDSSSSIGAPDDSDGEEEGEEAESKTALSSLDSLEESLPIKRGLSNHFTGKSKSFANLSEVLFPSSSVTVKDLEKPENPFNKRRRLLLANKWSRKSFYSMSNPKSMPLLALSEEEEQQNQDQVSQASPSSSSSGHELLENQPKFSKLEEMKFKKSFKSRSCFSLADLQHQEFE